FGPTLAYPLYASYLGGSGSEEGNAIAVFNPSGNTSSVNGFSVFGDCLVYVTGSTTSPDFAPSRPPGWQPYLGPVPGGKDAFVAGLRLGDFGNPQPVAFTYLGGGHGDDVGYGIAVDGNANVYVTGQTFSDDFPTLNAYQPVYGGSGDAFLTKLSPDLTTAAYSTFLGGNAADAGRGIALYPSPTGDLAPLVTGRTASSPFPTTPRPPPPP